MYSFLYTMLLVISTAVAYSVYDYTIENDPKKVGSKSWLKNQIETLKKINSEQEVKIKKLFSEKVELKRELTEKIAGFSRTELHFISKNIIENIERGTKIEVVSHSYKMIEKINKILEETDV